MKKLSAAVACLVLAGCAGTPEIPEGEWSGEGSFVFSRSDSEKISRDYATRLSIRSGEIDGREIIELEIVSERGPLPGVNEDEMTHLKVALAEDAPGSYRLVGLLLNPGPDAKLTYNEEGRVAATCEKVGDDVVLRIEYAERITDTFRFTGRQLAKNGDLFDDKGNHVSWSERLELQ